MENSGNEAKKYLKTKENHFFECCKLRAFWAQISTNRTLKGAKIAQLAQNEQKLRRQIESLTTTHCRLEDIGSSAGVPPALRLPPGLTFES
jgi:hypothetical protein